MAKGRGTLSGIHALCFMSSVILYPLADQDKVTPIEKLVQVGVRYWVSVV
jgi:hypothetical protein